MLLVGRDPSVAAIREGDWKLLVNPQTKYGSDDKKSTASTDPVVAADGARLELYNLADDISETHDLATKHAEKVKELYARYLAFTRDAVPPAKRSRKKAR